MVRFAVSTVKIVAPNGVITHWVVALPHSMAVAAVRQIIPTDHTAELSIRRFASEGLRPGEFREIKPMTHPKCPSDPNHTVRPVVGSAADEPRVSRRMLEYRAYAVGSDGRIEKCHEMLCRDDPEAVAKAKQLASVSDIEIWNRSRFVIRLVNTPKQIV
jgi:hypothetical protein